MKNITPKPLLKYWAYLKKDFMLLYSRKKYLITFLLLPIIIGSLFILLLNSSTSEIKIGVCDFDQSQTTLQIFNNIGRFKPIMLDNTPQCQENLKQGIQENKFPIGLVINKGFENNIQNLKQGNIEIHFDNTNAALARSVYWIIDNALIPVKTEIIDNLNSELTTKTTTLQEKLEPIIEYVPRHYEAEAEQINIELKNIAELETGFLVEPIKTEKIPIYSYEAGDASTIAYIFPIITIFIILMLSSTSFIYDKNNNFLTRVKTSSTLLNYLLAKITYFTALTFVQFILIFGIFFATGTRYNVSFPGIIELILFIAIIDSLLGLLIGLFSENEGLSVIFSLLISFPLMLLSGMFFPTETLPNFIKIITNILPLSNQIIAAKQALLFGQTITYPWFYISIGLFIIVYLIMRKKS